MGKKSAPPPAPDYSAAAEKTAASSQYAQDRADWANRPTINTPWGQESWQAKGSIDPSTGKPVTQWTQNTKLTPESQRALDSQMQLEQGRSDLANGMMGRVRNDFATPFDWNAMPARAGTPQGGQMTEQIGQGLSGFGKIDDSKINAMGGDVNSMVGDASRQRVEQGLLARLKPQQEQASRSLETQLANKGLTPGSQAYERERQRMSDSQSRQQFDALMSGGQEQMNQFNMALGAGQYDNQRNQQSFGQQMDRAGLADSQRDQQFREQAGAGEFMNTAQAQRYGQSMDSANFQNQNRQLATAEQMAQRNMGLNEMNALLSGQQIGMPDMPEFNTSQSTGGTNYSGAAKDQYGATMNAYNAKQQQGAGTTSALGSVASIGMMAF